MSIVKHETIFNEAKIFVHDIFETERKLGLIDEDRASPLLSDAKAQR